MAPGESPRTRLLIIVDAPLVRARLVELASEVPRLVVVGATSSGHEGIALSASLHPDVIIVDVMMSDVSGVALIAAVKAGQPAVTVLALTDIQIPGLERHYVEAGAHAVFVLPSHTDALVTALHLVPPPSGERHA